MAYIIMKEIVYAKYLENIPKGITFVLWQLPI